MNKNEIPPIQNIEMTKEQIKRKRELLSNEVKQIKIEEHTDFSSLIDAFSDSSFEARNLGRAAKLYHKQIKAKTAIIWSLSGSLFSAGLRQITIDAIRSNLVDALVCTGALFEQDMLEAIEPTIKQIESYDTTTVRASVPMYLLSKYIKEKTDIKVILSGEGSDELSGSYLYFHNAPTPHQFQIECERLINDVQHFDVLRCDKTTAGNSLEVRVPFFDKVFAVDYMNIEPSLKVVRDGYEKYLLRKSFENDLPNDIVWRRKDGFSDGVSLVNKPWYQIIQDYTQKNFQCSEKEYYQKIFSKYYKNYEYICPYEWLPKWSKESNPSGRLLLNE